jgi:hypothetical protein
MKYLTPSERAAEIADSARRLTEQLEAAKAEQPLKLAGSKEASRMLGIPYDTFHTMRKRRQLPEPVAELACGPIWLVSDLEDVKP